MKGVDILVLANTGTEAVPVWTAVGGQRGAKLSEKNDTIETTVKPAAGGAAYKTYEYGFSDWTISCDGMYVENDAAYGALVTAMRTRAKVKVRWSEGGSAVYEGDALITSRDLEGPYDAEATYAVELQGTGAPVLNPAP